MAKVKLNSLLADVRGRIGSNVFSSNAAGFYVKIMKAPVNPRSIGQSAIRSRFSFLVKNWTLLSVAERDAWGVYAARPDNIRYDWFGDPYSPNARAQFVSINTARLQAGLAYTATAPSGSLPADLPSFSCGIDPQGATFDSYLSPDAAFDGSIAYVLAHFCCVSSPARMTPVLPLRWLGTVEDGYSWPWEFNDLVTDAYGPIASYGRWFIALTPLSSECRPGTVLRYTAALGEEITP